MSGREPGEVTRLLDSWGTGSDAALDELMPIVYSELRAIAAGQLRGERADHTLQATALVNEAFLRLVNQDRVLWQNRGHFFAVAARAMRRILVDHARRRNARKRGGNDRRVPLDDVEIAVAAEVDLLELEASLTRLEALDSRQARIVELRFFAGCTMEEVAEALGISASTAKRQWRLARVWLRGELDRESPPGS
ncbi:MAG TPA: sigma-70 family RNA polymerase sigma factor [Thermoanaerobaculia bacterium]|nr:sigma-70 family RNA polymerase sigma factor [Thermoanaerobaculia bacterium]